MLYKSKLHMCVSNAYYVVLMVMNIINLVR